MALHGPSVGMVQQQQQHKSVPGQSRTIKCKDVGNLLCFYKLLIRSDLEFCTAAWSTHYAKDKVLIEKVQRRLTKMIPHLKNILYEERLSTLKLWSLED